MTSSGRRAALLVASDEDSYAVNSARKLAQQPGGTRELLLLSGAGHGTVDALPPARTSPPRWWTGFGARCYDRLRLATSPMKPESIVLAVAGIFFGILVGWVIGSQQASAQAPAVPWLLRVQSATAGAGGGSGRAARAAGWTRRRCRRSSSRPGRTPATCQSRVQLGNLYFDAERSSDAVKLVRGGAEAEPEGRQREHGPGRGVLLPQPAGPRARSSSTTR